MRARKFYLNTETRQFVDSASSNYAPTQQVFFDEDVESIELYFLQPSLDRSKLFDYADYSGATVKFAVGLTQPAALQTVWENFSTGITASVTTLVSGGSGSNEQQKLTFTPQPASGGWSLQFPARSITVSTVSANVFTAANHGLYSGQSVSLTAFSLTNSAVSNGQSYFVIRQSRNTFSLASTDTSTTSLSATATGGGTVNVDSVVTGQLSYNASPADVQAAIVAAGLTSAGAPQIIVTGTAGSEYLFTYANGSANRDYDPVSVVGSTLVGPYGLKANVNFGTTEIATLAASSSEAQLEIEVSDGTLRQTYRTTCTLSDDIVASSSSSPLATTTANGFRLMSPNGTVWEITPDNSGLLQSVSTTATSAPSGIALRSANGTAFTLSIDNDGDLQTA